MMNNFHIALAGNPNSGKSSLFNALTGLNQKIGNYPGVTVDKKTGKATINKSIVTHITDLPGTYSLYPKSKDELVSYDVLINPLNTKRPDLIIVVADACNLKRNLLLYSQIHDLKIPTILVLTMVDIAAKKGISIDHKILESELGTRVIKVNPRGKSGLKELKLAISDTINNKQSIEDFIPLDEMADVTFVHKLKLLTSADNNYSAIHLANSIDEIDFLKDETKKKITQAISDSQFKKGKFQVEETLKRYKRIDAILNKVLIKSSQDEIKATSAHIDKVLLHPIWGYVALLAILFLLFQSIFWLAAYPMDWIDVQFSSLQSWVSSSLKSTWWSDLLVNGLLAGIGGIVIFVPQIAILFFLITILEDTGYMARISFLSDRLMHSVGMNGKSVMPIISGLACAIPAVMASRTIENRTERLITIMITPLMSCTARLPVYAILIALVIPDKSLWGIFSLQGLVLMAMYLLGFFMAMIVAKIINWFIRTKEKNGYFLLELPVYKLPRIGNALMAMLEKAKVFVLDAGKIIMIISLVLWAMGSYGPGEAMNRIDAQYNKIMTDQNGILSLEQQDQWSSKKLENSYAGKLGKMIEPFIEPLGYDWKIGIALISSFAAREVFVGTMATLYSVGSMDDESTLKSKMQNAKRENGEPLYTLATGMSLMIFYAFAMQCMSTVAIVKRETKSWKWALFQLTYMTVLAYISAFLVFRIFS